MPEIPLYKQQVDISTETPTGIQLDLSSEAASLARVANIEAQGIENLTSGIADVITNYEELKDEASAADFANEFRDFKIQLAQGGLDYRKQNQDKPYNFQKDYIEPQFSNFKKRISEKNYSNRIKPSLMKEMEIEFSNIRYEHAVADIDYQTQNHIFSISNQAQQFIMDGNFKSGIDILDQMKNDQFITEEEYQEKLTTAANAFYNAQDFYYEDQLKEVKKSDLYKKLPEYAQEEVESVIAEKIIDFNKTVIPNNYDYMRKRIFAMGTPQGHIDGPVTRDDIEKLNLGVGNEDLRKTLYQALERKIKRTLSAFAKDEDNIKAYKKAGISGVDLATAYKDLNKVVKEYYNPSNTISANDNRNMQKITADLITEIDNSIIPEDVKMYFIDMLLETIKTSDGIQTFIKNDDIAGIDITSKTDSPMGQLASIGRKNTRYSEDTAWAWKLAWATYDEASDNLPYDKFSQSMALVMPTVSDKITKDRRYSIDILIPQLDALNISIEQFADNPDVILKDNPQLKDFYQSSKLLFDRNGKLLYRKHNIKTFGRFLDIEFDDYYNYKMDYMIKESLGGRAAPRSYPSVRIDFDKDVDTYEELLKLGELEAADEY